MICIFFNSFHSLRKDYNAIFNFSPQNYGVIENSSNIWFFFIRLQDFRCLWCHTTVHSICRGSFIQHCSLGETRPYTVPPTCLLEKGKQIPFIKKFRFPKEGEKCNFALVSLMWKKTTCRHINFSHKYLCIKFVFSQIWLYSLHIYFHFIVKSKMMLLRWYFPCCCFDLMVKV